MKSISAISTPDTLDRPWRSLHVFNLYRLTISGSIALIFFLATPGTVTFGQSHHKLFAFSVTSWLLVSLVSGFASRLRWMHFNWQAIIIILADIGFITLMIYSSSGTESGLGTLLLVTIAASGILVSGRLTFALAAIATLSLLFMHGYSVLTGHEADVGGYTRTGLLGAGLFAVALLTHVLALRVRESEALAHQRGQDLLDLAQTNELIIQQIDTGIMVVAHDGKILMLNDAARHMLNLDSDLKEKSLSAASPALAGLLAQWNESTSITFTPFLNSSSGNNLIPRFTRIGSKSSKTIAIFLEDASQLAHQAQQVKLASLGRLTASIAHEIRNPLSAINHASQLLAESSGISQQDLRLTEIIREQSHRLDTIVENVLSLSRKNEFKLDSMLIGPWLDKFSHNIISTHRLDPDDVQLATNNSDLTVQFDQSHLEQILCNLCDNAIRHSRGATLAKPLLKISCFQNEQNGNIEIHVVDSGPGIRDENMERLFEPFFTTESSGTGLGLYIARELSELNSARLSFIASDQGGAHFCLSLVPSKPE